MAADDVTGLIDVSSRLLGRAVLRVDRIHGGRNSQVFRLDCGAGSHPRHYVAKQYFAIPDDPRDRLGTEFRALEFLRSRNVANVPAPIAMDANARVAIYECAPGRPLRPGDARDDDVRQAVAFLAELKTLARRGGAPAQSASEACFSIDAIADSLAARAARLRALADDAPAADDLRRFLGNRFDPFVSTLDAWTGEQARQSGLSRDAELPLGERTLSPSDFGFHNALRDDDGRLVFVDFEYFGWDDPAKAVVDFLLHPAMDVTADRRRAFATGVLNAFSDLATLQARARIVYPWFGLRWCLIVLNEFVPGDLRRRRFAGVADASLVQVMHRQLACAERLLDRVDAEYRRNPYLDR